MSPQPFKAQAYLLEGCPYSFKFLLFMAEARLLEHIEIVRVPAAQAERVKETLQAQTGRHARFPTVEIEPGRYQWESDQLIALYAGRHGVAADALVAFDFYKTTIFPQLLELHRHQGARRTTIPAPP